MLFNSLVFLVFFLVTYQVFWRLPAGWRKHWLLLTSLFFYGWWDWRFLIHFGAITIISYGFVLLLLRRRSALTLGVAIGLNLANLVFFKYTNSVLLLLANDLGFSGALVLKQQMSLVLPLAISFYTFQITAFLVDTYRGEISKILPVDFVVFIMFFPQLIAGPIMRHGDFLEQLEKPKLDETSLPDGLFLLIVGLFKKVFVADGLAALIDDFWKDPSQFGSAAAAPALVGFLVQIYCDFSGYTDMARGMARLLGYNIPENFYAPYMAPTFSEFWKRWHVTLSTWLRDYLYIPLGGNRVSAVRFNLNVLLVMSLGGLWHGNTFTFLLWGFINGVYLVVERLLGADKPPENLAARAGRTVLTHALFCLAAVFFRASDLGVAARYYSALFSPMKEGLTDPNGVFELIALGWALLVMQHYHPRVEAFVRQHQRWLLPALSALVFFMLARIERSSGQFIYFQF